MDNELNLIAPVEFTIKNDTSINQAIRYYKCNFQQILKPGDSVKLIATTSEQLAYYVTLNNQLGEHSGETKTVLEFPDPLDIGSSIDQYISQETMLGLIAASAVEPASVIIKQGSIAYPATVEEVTETACTLKVDESNELRYTINEEVEPAYGMIQYKNGLEDWNIVVPH